MILREPEKVQTSRDNFAAGFFAPYARAKEALAPFAWRVRATRSNVERCSICRIVGSFLWASIGSKAELFGRKRSTGGICPFADQVCCSRSMAPLQASRALPNYPEILCMSRYSSAFSNGKDIYRSAVDTENNPIKLAEAMLDSMRVDHWRSSSLSVQCNASTMHAILRAPRGDGKEAIVLATPVYGMQQKLTCCIYLVATAMLLCDNHERKG